MVRFNEILEEVVTKRPDVVRVVDLAGYLRSRPEGELDRTLRPDGVHFTKRTSLQVFTEWLGAELLRVYAEARGPAPAAAEPSEER